MRLQVTKDCHWNWTIEDWKKCCLNWCVLISPVTFRIWHKQHENIDPPCLISMVRIGGSGTMVWRIFFWHTLRLLIPVKDHLNVTTYPDIVVNHMSQFMPMVHPSTDGHISRHNSKIVTDWFMEWSNKFTALKWSSRRLSNTC